jgi:hypothetical protein
LLFVPQLTLSSLPKSRWQNLPILDLIKVSSVFLSNAIAIASNLVVVGSRLQERNKPKEAPKAPATPSFFLTTTQGLNPQLNPFADPAMTGKQESKDGKEGTLALLPLRLLPRDLTGVFRRLCRQEPPAAGHVDADNVCAHARGGCRQVTRTRRLWVLLTCAPCRWQCVLNAVACCVAFQTRMC